MNNEQSGKVATPTEIQQAIREVSRAIECIYTQRMMCRVNDDLFAGLCIVEGLAEKLKSQLQQAEGRE